MPGAPDQKTPAPVRLEAPIVGQNPGTFWCWAAVCASLVRYYDRREIRACEVASNVLEVATCCSDPGPCDKRYLLSKALEAFGHLQTGGGEGCAADADLHAELAAGRPVAASIRWPNLDHHFVVIYGVDLVQRSVTVLDPLGAGALLHSTLDAIRTDYANRGGVWDWTYYTWR